MQNETSTLATLNQLMNEFFSPNTTNVRKREIESQLESFSNQRDSWKLCLFFIKHSYNQYVSMFAMTSIETTISRQWPSLNWESRSEIKSTLWAHLIEHYASSTPCSAPIFLRNKLAKLIVDIGRQDWPHFYPDFFDNILQLVHSEQGRILGLILLRTVSEELGKPRDDLSSARRTELFRLMQMHIPSVLQTLTVLLEDVAKKQKDKQATKTPPPSPTQPNSSPQIIRLSDATSRPDSRETCFEILLTLQHIFSWVNLNEVSSSLVRTIYYFASSMSYTQDDDNICVLSLTTLSEILYRKTMPPGCEPLLIQLSVGALQLLSHITNDSVHSGQLDTLSNSFIEKLTEFLQLLIELYFKRLESEPNFSIMNFLSLLFKYTFQQTNINLFIPCLDIWRAFLKQIKHDDCVKDLKCSISGSPNFKYSDIIVGLTTNILNKIQFQHNHGELEELDNEQQFNEEESEFQHFIYESVEILALVAEFAPIHIFNLVAGIWMQQLEIYFQLHSAIDLTLNKLNLANEKDEMQLHFVLKDLITLTQILSRLATCFMDEEETYYEASIEPIKHFFSKLTASALYASKNRFYTVQTSQVLSTDLIDVHSNLLTGLTSWCLWPMLTREMQSTQLACEIITPCILMLIAAIDPSHGNVANATLAGLIHSATLLLLRITNIAMPEILISYSPIQDLVQLTAVNNTVQSEVIGIIRQALFNLALSPLTNTTDSSGAVRSNLLYELVEKLTSPLRNLENPCLDIQQAHVIIETILPSLATLIEQYRNHNSTIKKTLCASIKEPIQRVLNVYPKFSNFPDLNEHILSLFLTVIDVLRLQLGVEYTKQIVQMFLNVTLSKQNDISVSGMDKLLIILQLIVEEPGASFRCLLPSVIDLCLQHALPIISNGASDYPDLATALYRLLHSILLHRWQFFNQSQVRLGNSPGASDTFIAPSEIGTYQHCEQLLAILQAFGQALLQSDINIFKLSLLSLENLNTKWKLYHIEIFRKQLLPQFLNVLLQAHLNKSHALLSDEITMAIYNMASVDFNAFTRTFLPEFLKSTAFLDNHQKETLMNNFSHEADVPTFTQNINRLITDMRYYRVCNTSGNINNVLL